VAIIDTDSRDRRAIRRRRKRRRRRKIVSFRRSN
jgi:hypothetical protein